MKSQPRKEEEEEEEEEEEGRATGFAPATARTFPGTRPADLGRRSAVDDGGSPRRLSGTGRPPR